MSKALYVQLHEIKGEEENSVSFTHQYTPSDENLKNSRGSLYLLLVVKGASGASAVAFERQLYQAFQTKYYSNLVGGVLASLEAAFDQTLDLVKKKTQEIPNIGAELFACVLWGEAIYVVKTQGAGIIFVRSQNVKNLQFNKVASGSVRAEDRILLANRAFINKLDSESLKESAGVADFQEFAKSIESKLPDKKGVIALVLKIGVEEPKQEALEMMEVKNEPNKLAAILSGGLSSIKDAASNVGKSLSPLASKAVGQIKLFILPILEKIAEPWRSRQPGEAVDFAKRRRARAAQIVVILIILLILSVLVALFNRASAARKEEFNKKISAIEAVLVEAENLASISSGRAESLLVEAEGQLSEAKDLNQNSDKIEELFKRLETLKAEVRKVYQVSLEDFYTVDDAEIISLENLSSNLIGLDGKGAKVFILDTKTKTDRELISEGKSVVIVTYGDFAYLQSNQGVDRINTKSLSRSEILNPSPDWGSIIKGDTYEGNLYFLDQGKTEVWKYAALGNSFSAPLRYFNKGKPTPENFSSIAIDGAVWLGSKDGKISKYLGGRKQEFEIKGLDKPLGEIADLFTSSGTDKLFVLDKSNARLVILKKDGQYLAQYTSDDLNKTSSLVVEEQKKTIYFGVGNKIKILRY